MKEGDVNGYDCPRCGKTTWTVDVDEGVTPFMLRCRATDGCSGMARSRFYQVPTGHPEPTHEWYRLSDRGAKKRGPGGRSHHENGGLFLRKREPVE